ncbi:MAG: hypothetical protein JJT78_00300 [Leptospira sp.]|nr:hypothetical protein [Leptospira sp.]
MNDIKRIGSIIILLLVWAIISKCSNHKSNDLQPIMSLFDSPILWKSYFSFPGRDVSHHRQVQVRDRIVDMIDNTNEELEIHIYGLTDLEIIEAIERARNRGLRVRIVVDSDRNYSGLENIGIPLDIWRGSGLHHPKVIISDTNKVFTGTGNFTTQGLLKDFDSYMIAENIPQSKAKKFRDFLREETDEPVFQLGSLYFMNAPRDGLHIQKKILDHIRGAKSSIKYLIYTHFDELISHELVKAAKRGIIVEGIYDRPINPEGKYLAEILPLYGSIIYEEENEDKIDNGTFGLGGLLHHKTMIIDDSTLLSGSYNYSRSARDMNREIFYESMDPIIVREHIFEFQRVRDQSRIFRKEKKNEKDDIVVSEPLVLDWGIGIFRSQGMIRNSSSDVFLPISSGVFSMGNVSRRNIPRGSATWSRKSGELLSDEESLPIHTNFFSDQFFENQPNPQYPEFFRNVEGFSHLNVFTVDGRLQNGTLLRMNTSQDFIEGILWTQSGQLVSSSMRKWNDNSFIWGAELPSEAINTGLFFFRNQNGVVNSMACYVLGNRNIPRFYEYLLRENYIQKRILNDAMMNCDRLGEFGG